MFQCNTKMKQKQTLIKRTLFCFQLYDARARNSLKITTPPV